MRAPAFLAGLLAAFGAVLLGAHPKADAADAGPQVVEILASLRASPPEPVGDVARRLVELGPDALPDLLDAWWSDPGRLPASARGRSRTPPSCAALQQAIGEHGARRLVRHLETCAAAHPDDAARLRLLEAVATFGEGTALPVALDVVGGLDPNWLRTPSLVTTWQATLDGLLERGAGRADLLTAWNGFPLPLRAPSCRVLVERGTAEALALVFELAEREEAAAPALYREASRASPILLERLRVLPGLRRKLATGDGTVRACIADVLALLGDAAVFDDLLALLEDDDPGVRSAAEAALRKLTGVSHGPRPATWRAWLAAERTWLTASAVADRLLADDPVVIARALREIGGHRLVAETLVEPVADLLEHDVVGIRLLACAALRLLGRAAAALPLVDALEDEDAGVRAAVWQTLKQLSRERLPLEARAWKQARRRWTS